MTRWVTVAAAVVLVALLVGCSDDDGSDRSGEGSATTEPTPAEITGVELLRETFVDPTRPTPPSQFEPGSDQRSIETVIAYPTPLSDEYPLILLAHGHLGHPDKFSRLMETWAMAGYVVVAPTFPRSTDQQTGGSAAGTWTDLANQPGDVSFVLDEVLEMAAGDDESPLSGHLDAERIGLAGHSLGGSTTFGTLFNTCCTDERIDVGMMLSPGPAALYPLFPGEPALRPVPTLVVAPEGDFMIAASQGAYADLMPPKWFVTLQSDAPESLDHYSVYEDTPNPADAAVEALTTAFWDWQLENADDAEARFTAAAQPDDGSAVLESQPA